MKKKGLAKVEEGLRECGLKENEVKSLMNFLSNYLKLKGGKQSS
ncbi:MAG: hypothetical protein QW040_02370 [Candidatus Aenigmatarchaeota archaeon]